MEASLDFLAVTHLCSRDRSSDTLGHFLAQGLELTFNLPYVTCRSSQSSSASRGFQTNGWWMNAIIWAVHTSGPLGMLSMCSFAWNALLRGPPLADLSCYPQRGHCWPPSPSRASPLFSLHTLFISVTKLAPYHSYLIASSPACDLSLSWVSKFLSLSTFCMFCTLPYN